MFYQDMKFVTLAWQNSRKQLVMADSFFMHMRIQPSLLDIHIMENQCIIL